MHTHPPKPTIVITGGNFVNKGAESMLMSTVEAIRTHFPTYEPVLLDLFPTMRAQDKGKYSFRIVNMHVRSLYRICFPLLKLLFKPKDISNSESEIKATINTASAIFDVSGYGLSSHNQPLLWSMAYLLPIYMAKRKGVPVWLLPQSMGPFQFKGLKKYLFRFLAIPVLQYPEIIFVREPSGLAAVRQFRKKPALLSPDIVLQVPDGLPPDSQSRGSGILVIPNQQLFRVVGVESILQVYETLIRQLLDREIPIRVIQHSKDDRTFCELLKGRITHELFAVESRVLSMEDLNLAINASRFIISGRYHGAIHSLKLHKPVVIIGWAEKYRHLAAMFGLDEQLIDLSNGKVPSSIDEVVDNLIADEQIIIDSIEGQLGLIKQDSLWNQIHLK
jgi:polysaccharide pyruvyl transferase WcaK-like protein